jgi:Family of unknown function (DUF6516)
VDYELEALLSLNGHQFHFAKGYMVKLEAREIASTKGRPHGVKYSLSLHDPRGRRIYGIDNAHRIGRHREFDHKHPHSDPKVLPYAYRGAVALLEDFYHEVERILRERGVA